MCIGSTLCEHTWWTEYYRKSVLHLRKRMFHVSKQMQYRFAVIYETLSKTFSLPHMRIAQLVLSYYPKEVPWSILYWLAHKILAYKYLSGEDDTASAQVDLHCT